MSMHALPGQVGVLTCMKHQEERLENKQRRQQMAAEREDVDVYNKKVKLEVTLEASLRDSPVL